MGSTRKLLILVAVLLGLVIALPFIVPLDRFVSHDIQKSMSAKLKRRVTISDVSFSYAPYPTITLEKVEIGAGGKDGSISSIELQIDLLTAFSDDKRLRKFLIKDASLTQSFLEEIPALLKPSSEKKDYITRQISWSNSYVRTANHEYGPIEAEIALNPDQSFNKVTLHDKANTIDVQIRPLKDHFAISALAKNWTPEFQKNEKQSQNETAHQDKFKFESLVVEAETQGMAIMVHEAKGDLGHGHFKGSAVVDWSNGWAITSQFEISKIDGDFVTPFFNDKTHTSGKINGSLDYSTSSDSLDTLFKHPTVKFRFDVTGGVLSNFDFVKPIRHNTDQNGVQGGSTKFDHLSGLFAFQGNKLSFTDVKLKSGALAVSANIFAIDNKLSGSAFAKLGNRSTSLRVSGNFDKPLLIPPSNSNSESSVTVITN